MKIDAFVAPYPYKGQSVGYQWFLKRNGFRIASGPVYTRKRDAVRGLNRFMEVMKPQESVKLNVYR